VETRLNAAEVQRLERDLRDVVALSTLPAIWFGAEPLRIAESLGAALFTTLACRLVYVALADHAGGTVAVAQVDRSRSDPELARRLGPDVLDWARRHDPDELLTVPGLARDELLRVAARPVGHHGELGVVAAGFSSPSAPGPTAHLLLHIAATQAATAVRSARLLRSLRESEERARDAYGALEEHLAELRRAHAAREASLRAAEEARAQAEASRDLVEQAPVMVWATDAAGMCTFLSRSWYEFTGQTPETGLGAGWLDAVHPEDRAESERRFLEANAAGESFSLEYRLRRVDGVYRWAIDSGRPRASSEGRHLGYVGSVLDVHERRLAERALTHRERLLRTITDNAATAIFMIDTESRCTFMNPAAEAMTGYRFDEVEGRILHDVIHHTRPDGRPYPVSECPIDRARPERAEVRGHEDVFVRKNGEAFPVLCNARPIWTDDPSLGTVVEVQDVSAFVQARRDAATAAERYGTLVSVLTDVPWTTDASGAFATPQPAWAAYTGQSFEEHRGFGWGEAVHPDDRARVRALWQDAVRARTAYESRARIWHAASRAYRHVVARAAPIFDESGNLREWVGTCTDVHEQTLADRALKEADRRKDEFLAMLAHELRNPLAPIRNAAEIVRMTGGRDSTVVLAGEIIERQVAHMTRLVDDLLDVSRFTRGRIALEKEPLRLQDIVDAAVEASRPDVQGKEHVLGVHVTPGTWVEGDRARLVQIVTNLLTNAAKFTPRGGFIELRCEPCEAGVRIAVRDTGIGIAKEAQERIFELFHQEDASLDRSQGGLGIGLTLVKRLVEMHGGSVGVASEGPGKGSEFSVTLPVLAGDAAEGAASPADRAGRAGALRVLVVEDNEDAAESFRVLLAMRGHEVEVARNGLEALALVERAAPDVAFVDLGLPGVDGFGVAERIRARGGRGPVLVAISGYGREEDKQRARRAGFDEHMTKPVDYERVERVLAGVRDARQAEAAGAGRTTRGEA